MTDALLTREEAAERLRTTAGTLAYWASVGKGPKYVRFGRRALYAESDLTEFIADSKRTVA